LSQFDYLALYNHSTHSNVSIRKTIVSEDILDKDFVCNLSACKGACCVDGDAGAPLSLRKLNLWKKYIQSKTIPSQRNAAIEAQGSWVKGTDGELETPLIDNKDCAYSIF
jgi:hypothetical protein